MACSVQACSQYWICQWWVAICRGPCAFATLESFVPASFGIYAPCPCTRQISWSSDSSIICESFFLKKRKQKEVGPNNSNQTVFYIQSKQLTNAWLMCGSATRLAQAHNLYSHAGQNAVKSGSLVKRILWANFMLEAYDTFLQLLSQDPNSRGRL